MWRCLGPLIKEKWIKLQLFHYESARVPDLQIAVECGQRRSGKLLLYKSGISALGRCFAGTKLLAAS